ncbi:hypothetical protein QBC43DRAFT_245228 [Cladorrhinum sp. PSN259]|nr:hypothetical protein QBC43DRAFT_245228 [Cladorrhinum sp. PSN259]
MQAPFPSPTATWRNDTYDAISPSRPELSVAGKTVVIIGAGSGIGRETARAFATAGAAHVALLGRNEEALIETSSLIPPSAKSSVHVADVTKSETLDAAAAAIGTWNVLVVASGYCPNPSAIASSDPQEWERGLQVNVLGTALTAKAFLPTADATSAAILGITSDTSLLPPSYLPGLAAYVSTKLAQAKVYEFLAAENPGVFVATAHPGMVDTHNFRATGATPEGLPMNTVQLPAHFLVWLASPEAAFLRGRSAWANWDVEELKAQKEKYTQGLFMAAGFKGLP